MFPLKNGGDCERGTNECTDIIKSGKEEDKDAYIHTPDAIHGDALSSACTCVATGNWQCVQHNRPIRLPIGIDVVRWRSDVVSYMYDDAATARGSVDGARGTGALCF